jgi:pimeloyl-ACP methyl ester carboxylesterase
MSATGGEKADAAPSRPRTTAAFGSLEQIAAGLLHVGYADVGPADGRAVVLLHGWPYDIHSYVDVAPILASAGYRVVVPYLRGFGATRFLSDETFRNGEQAALALDVIALMDALEVESAILAGFDWGARTADIVAALWPERCTALVSVSGYLIGSQEAGKRPLPPEAELEWWYQYYFATERGRVGYDKYRRDFAKLIWRTASPRWNFDDATFDRSAASFGNPDHVEIVIHNYRWRLGFGRGRRELRRSGGAARRRAGDHRADDHPRRRRQWRAASGPEFLCREVLGRVFAPNHRGRHRAQPSSGSSGSVCQGRHRRRRALTCRDLPGFSSLPPSLRLAAGR